MMRRLWVILWLWTGALSGCASADAATMWPALEVELGWSQTSRADALQAGSLRATSWDGGAVRWSVVAIWDLGALCCEEER
jgi:hypothetical protein